MSTVSPASTITFGTTVTTGARTQLVSCPARTVMLRAAKTNSAAIWIGDSTVTTAGAGKVLIDLQPGEAAFLDINNANLLYSASAASQTLYVSGLS